VLACAAGLGLACEIADLSWHQLTEASEVFVTNSLIGIWPVRVFGAYQWVAPGLRTRQLMLALGHPQLSADP